MLHSDFNWKQPDYKKVYDQRIVFLKKIRAAPAKIPALKTYYKNNPADFISDFGITHDPRSITDDVPALLPFILFPKQVEWVNWIVDRWKRKEGGLTEKSRDMGMSWLSMSLACTLCLFYKDIAIGFGSRKAEYVDFLGSPRALFPKARLFMSRLPKEFRGGWDLDRDAPHMRLSFPGTGSNISGEAGDNIGRGDRTSIYFVDEAAYLERPNLVEASLSQTTNCRIDFSSANGTANPFFQKRTRWAGTDRLFTFHWRFDPRKDQAWYDKQVEELDPVVVAAEIDIDYSASVEGVLIPNAWVQAAVDAHVKLGFQATGSARASLDVADEGRDKNASVGGRGSVIEHAKEWSGKGIDIYQTTLTAFAFCDDFNYPTLGYDADGLGAGVRGDSKAINDQRARSIEVVAYRGSEGVEWPEREDEPGRQNKDFFANRKAQSWWRLRRRFERTWRAVAKGIAYNPDELISLSSEIEGLQQICMELSQPTFTRNEAGKVVVDKMPEGAASPNKADAVLIWSQVTGEATAAFFEEGDMLVNAEPVAVDKYEIVFATLHASGKPGKDNMGTGVVYWATQLEGPLLLLDWDYTAIEGAMLDVWIPEVFARLDGYTANARMGCLGIYMSDEGQNPGIMEKAIRYGEVQQITGRLMELDARGQAIAISTHVGSGQVRLAEGAVSKTVLFRGAKRNHLLGQVRKFTADSKDVEDMTMLRTFVYGVSIALESEA